MQESKEILILSPSFKTWTGTVGTSIEIHKLNH